MKGVELKKLLKEAGWTHKEFADMSGVTRETVTAWCSSEEVPKHIVKYLEMYSQWIYTVKENNSLRECLLTIRKTIDLQFD